MTQLEDTGERLIPEGHTQTLTYGEHLARYAAALDLVKDKVVLDIASGTGYGSALLAGNAEKVIGVDYSAEAVEYSQKHYPIKNLIFKVGDAQKLPLEDSTIDIVVSLETIEHLPKPELFIQEVKRVLKPGGVLIVSTPNDNEFTEGNEYHIHEFDFKELDRLMRKYFKNFEYYFQGSWFSSGILSKRLFEEATGTLSLPISKTFVQSYKKAIYFIAIASDKQIDRLQENLVVADVYSAKQAQEQSLRLSAHIEALNKELANEHVRVAKLGEEKNKLENELRGILSSRGWKLMQSAYKVKRTIKRSK